MRVVLGLSGGVDSSLATALLKERGFDVLGVYLKFGGRYGEDSSANGDQRCPWKDDIAMCRRIASFLDIPFIIRDVTTQYEERVLAPMVRAYAAGETPNPDGACNRLVKFSELLAVARANGAGAIATGHYARLRRVARGRVMLLRGADHGKDQSYFLWSCTAAQLAATMFPVGYYTKDQVRAMARARGLPNWDRRSTRGVCFLGGADIPAYLAERVAPRAADVHTTAGEHIGSVPFAQALTVGQRIRIGGRLAPHYVVARNLHAHTVTVSATPDDPARARSVVRAGDAHWIGAHPPRTFACTARIRHRQQPVPCMVSIATTGCTVRFDAPQEGVAPGQSVVFTDGDTVLGGATIL